MFNDITTADVFAVYEQLKDKYPLEMTTAFALDDGFEEDCPVLAGKAHGQAIQLYEHGNMFVLDVMDEARTQGTHWHPCDVKGAVGDIAEFMEGKSDYEFYPFNMEEKQ